MQPGPLLQVFVGLIPGIKSYLLGGRTHPNTVINQRLLLSLASPLTF